MRTRGLRKGAQLPLRAQNDIYTEAGWPCILAIPASLISILGRLHVHEVSSAQSIGGAPSLNFLLRLALLASLVVGVIGRELLR